MISMMRRQSFRGALLLLTSILGCDASHTVAVSPSQRVCSTDSDCVPVYEGTLGCCGPGCANAAINKTSYAGYQATIASRAPTCTPPPPCAGLSDQLCKAGAVCRNGTCEFASLTADAQGD